MADHKFRLGRLVITPGAFERVVECGIDVALLLARHQIGDWGELDPEDRKTNEWAVGAGARILSAYGRGERRLWIITEADRSSTCVLRPEDY